LKPARDMGKYGRRRSGINNTPLRKSIAVRTFSDWNDPPPGFFEMDMVAHCGKSVAGSHAHSLVLTDIASGWTEGAAMVVREQTLITLTVEEVRLNCHSPCSDWTWTTIVPSSMKRLWTTARIESWN
jgi:hypothetical protein